MTPTPRGGPDEPATRTTALGEVPTMPPSQGHHDAASSTDRRRDARAAGGTALVAVAALAGAAIAARALDVPFGEFLIDPSSRQGAHIGLLSTAGVMVWTAGGAIAVFAGLVVGTPRNRTFLVTIGAFTVALAADDAFLIHEGVLPRLAGTDSIELAVFGLYGLAAATIGFRFWRQLRGHAPWWLVTSLALLGVSLLIDLFGEQGELLHDLKPLEDAPKWAGVLLWTTWLVRTTSLEIGPPTPQG